MPQPTFTDLSGRVWPLTLNFGLAQDIRKSFPGVDFLNAHNGQAFQVLGSDDEVLVGVLWMLCEQQATAQQITPEAFAAGLAGDALEAAEEALERCVILFTRPARRPVLEVLLGKARETSAKAMTLTTQKVSGEKVDRLQAQMLEDLDEQIDRLLAKPLSMAKSSGTSGPASPASIPDRTP